MERSGTSEWDERRLVYFRCVRCGYGAARRAAPERCPMCGGGGWEDEPRRLGTTRGLASATREPGAPLASAFVGR